MYGAIVCIVVIFLYVRYMSIHYKGSEPTTDPSKPYSTDIYIEVGKAMLARQTKNVTTPIKWDNLMASSQAGYIEDAKVAIEKYEELRNAR